MNRFFCWLTGGHRYEDKNLICKQDLKTRKHKISNHCVKCGKQYYCYLDIDRIVQEEKKRLTNRLYVSAMLKSEVTDNGR